MGALLRTGRGVLVASAALLLTVFCAGCGSDKKKRANSYPNDAAAGKCVSSWNRAAPEDLHAQLATAAQNNADKAVLAYPVGTDPSLKSLGRCMVVQVGTEDRPNVAFIEDDSGTWSASNPINPPDYASNRALFSVVNNASFAPNTSVGSTGELTLNYPYSVAGAG
jgi:hypothetical protein